MRKPPMETNAVASQPGGHHAGDRGHRVYWSSGLGVAGGPASSKISRTSPMAIR
jgi:hypothetical protein